MNYYKNFSLIIEDDYLFEETLISYWKLSKAKHAYSVPKNNVKNIIQTPEEKKKNKNHKIFLRKMPGIKYNMEQKPNQNIIQIYYIAKET